MNGNGCGGSINDTGLVDGSGCSVEVCGLVFGVFLAFGCLAGALPLPADWRLFGACFLVAVADLALGGGSFSLVSMYLFGGRRARGCLEDATDGGAMTGAGSGWGSGCGFGLGAWTSSSISSSELSGSSRSKSMAMLSHGSARKTILVATVARTPSFISLDRISSHSS